MRDNPAVVQTAGTEIPLTMRYVKSPNFTAQKILDIQQQASLRRRSSDFGKRSVDRLISREGENYTQEELAAMRKEKRGSKPHIQRDLNQDEV